MHIRGVFQRAYHLAHNSTSTKPIAISLALLFGVGAGYVQGERAERDINLMNARIDNVVINTSDTAPRPSISQEQWERVKLTAEKPETQEEIDALHTSARALLDEVNIHLNERRIIVNKYVDDVKYEGQANITVHPEMEQAVRKSLERNRPTTSVRFVQIFNALLFGGVLLASTVDKNGRAAMATVFHIPGALRREEETPELHA